MLNNITSIEAKLKETIIGGLENKNLNSRSPRRSFSTAFGSNCLHAFPVRTAVNTVATTAGQP